MRCFFDREPVSAEILLPGNSGNQAKTMTSFTLLTGHYPTVCVCVWVDHLYRCKPLLSARGMAVVSLAMPTKLWDSAGRECARTLLYLHIFYIVPPLGAFKSQLGGHIVYRSRFISSTPPVILNIYIYMYTYI